MKVLKFGGTSVGSPERFRALIPLISGKEPKIVVLSAMSGTTNGLIEISSLFAEGKKNDARKKVEEMRSHYHTVVNGLLKSSTWSSKGHDLIDEQFNYIDGLFSREYSRHNEKRILARGEQISTALLHFLLGEEGVPSILIPALHFMRVDKDGEPDYFYIRENLNRELERCENENIIITQGFICRNAYGETDNLKRGGSDYSATIIGAAIGSEEVQIWTDIDGLHNNDPRYVEDTGVIRELSFAEAAELAYFGAKILHPSSINPARLKSIPVRLKNTMEPNDVGTLITSTSNPADYKAVAAKDGITAIRIKSDRMLMAYGFLRKVFEVFEAYRTSIDMIATSEVEVSITIDDPGSLSEIIRALSEYGTVEAESDQTIICVLGDFRTSRIGSAPEIFESLNSIPVKMISYGGSDNNVSILINTKDKVQALKSLSKNLFTKNDN
jgi:aspartate kinase